MGALRYNPDGGEDGGEGKDAEGDGLGDHDCRRISKEWWFAISSLDCTPIPACL